MTVARARALPAVSASLALALQPPLAFALPQGGVVSVGEASIAQYAGSVVVSQSSDRAVIDWTGFDIGSGEGVQFFQPHAGAIALNRVNSGSPSQILGNLSANGNVWIVNPNGVLFGQGAVVNVGGLLASTANISNENFMAGNYRFDQAGAANASVINQGQVTVAQGGLAAFVAPQVKNSGYVTARLGRVEMASGETFTLDMYGDGLLSVEAGPALSQQLVENSGAIEADGGVVVLSTAAAQGVVAGLINMDGIILARSIASKEGKIIIAGEKNGDKSTVMVSGRVDASGTAAGEKGGSIDVLGDRIAILAGAELNASGHAGGGSIRIGGDYQGQGVTPTAQRVIVQGGSNIFANALVTGNGGRVIVWADQRTDYAGYIEAKGGSVSGDGGFVETSGKEMLVATGIVDASSPWGIGGLWLLDPNNITINTTANANASSSGANPVVWDTTDDSAVVTVASILTSLNAGTSVTVQTGTAGANTQAGNITVASDIGKTAGGDATLTLKAANDIIVNSNVDITSSSNRLNVTFNADADASGAGAILMSSGSTIVTNGGNIAMGGGADPTTTAAIGNATNVSGIQLNAASLNAGAGSISLRGQGYANAAGSNNFGVYLNNATAQTTSGNISFTGVGGAGIATNYGVNVTNTSTVTTQSGAIGITGTGGSGGTTASHINNHGVNITATTNVTSTGTGGGLGALTINGTAAATNHSYSHGVYIALFGTTVSTVDANLVVTGVGGNPTSFSNDGVQLFGNMYLRSTGTGNLTVTGTGGAGGAGSGFNYGIHMNNTARLTVASGILTATGTGGTGAVGSNKGFMTESTAVTVGSAGPGSTILTGIAGTGGANNTAMDLQSGNFGGAASTGNITLIADDMNYSGITFDTDGDITVRPYTNGTTMGLGTGAGTLSLTSTELGYFSDFANIYFGDGNTGNIAINTNAALLDRGNVYFRSDGDITLSGTLTKTGGGNSSLFFQADNSIISSGSADITASGNELDVVFNADRDASGAGAISLGSGTVVTSNGGDITLGGGADPTATAAYGTAASVYGVYLNSAAVNAGGGNVSVRGTGYNTTGVHVAGASGAITTTGSGSIAVAGTGGGTGGYGVYVVSGGLISAVDGAVSVTGQGSTTSTNTSNLGVYVNLSGGIRTTGSGNITVQGTGGGTGGGTNLNYGVYAENASNGIHAAGSGNITITGTGGAGASSLGVRLNAASVSAVSGTTTITGTGGTYGIFTNASGDTIGGASTTGDITLNADTVALAAGTSIRTAGNVYIRPYSSNGTIGLNGAAGTLGLTSTYLSYINAGSTIIGRTDGSGLMRVAGADLSSYTLGNLSLLNGSGNIQFDGGGTALTLAANMSFSTASTSGSFTTSATGSIVTSGTGDITIDDPVTQGGNLTLTSADALAFGGTVNGGYDLTASAAAFSFASAWGGSTPLDDVSLTSANSLTLPSITAASVFARTTGAGADITVPLGRTLTASAANTAITLASADDFTNASASPFALTGGGRWLVYSETPADNSLSGLAPDFFRYSCAYGGSCPTFPATGNGLLYSTTPLLTATPGGITLTYGDAAPNLAAYTYTLSGYLGSDSASDSVTGALTGSTAYTQGSNAGSYNVSYSSGALASTLGYGFTYANNASAVTVGKKALTATAQDQAITYGTATPTLSKGNTSHVTFAGLYGSDTGADLDSVTFSYGGATAGSVNNAGTYTLSISAFSDNNYTLSIPGGVTNGTLTIGKRGLTVTIDNAARTYGDANPAFTAVYTGFVNGDDDTALDTLPTFSSAAASANAGSHAITGVGGLDNNYTYSSFVNGTLTINKANVVVTANNAGMTAGGSLPSFSASYGGLKLGQNLATSGITGSPSLTTAATGSSPAGTYAILAALGSLSSGNYHFSSFIDGVLTITAASGGGVSMIPSGVVREMELRPRPKEEGDGRRADTLRFTPGVAGLTPWHCFIFGLPCGDDSD